MRKKNKRVLEIVKSRTQELLEEVSGRELILRESKSPSERGRAKESYSVIKLSYQLNKAILKSLAGEA